MAPLFSLPHGGRRWDPVSLALAAVLMAFDPGRTLLERFESARGLLGVRSTYQGWVKAMRRLGPALLGALQPRLRDGVRRVAGDAWRTGGVDGGFVPIAADGSRFDAPRTIANEALGTAGRLGCGPQMVALLLLHLGSGLIWDWRVGGAAEGERGLLRAMLDDLPERALLVMDAGFIGFEFLGDLHARGVSFLLRVGENATLLEGLTPRRSRAGTMHIWRRLRPGRPPLAVRVIRVGDAWLITNVLDPRRLSRAAAAELYRRRWDAEVMFRTIKQTMQRRKMRSASPANARLELEWTLVAATMLGLLGTRALTPRGVPTRRLSMAAALGAVRRAMTRPPGAAASRLTLDLSAAGIDEYHRRSSKTAYRWPHKKNETPPRAPIIRAATPEERRMAAA